ncbi:MAG: flavodoxin domain-containing protein [Actinomycetes bacterium]
MRTLIVYESMYGRTHEIADRVADGLRSHAEVQVVPVSDATDEKVAWADLLVVGGPTHAHGMTSAPTRRSAAEAATKPDSALALDPDAEGPGLRDWFNDLGPVTDKRAAAFDTRLDSAPVLTGRASRGITHRLRKHGFTMVGDAMSFLVDRQTELVAGEPERAVAWGKHLAETYTWPPVSYEPGYREGAGRTI